jgi:transmembrane sensor
MQRHPPKLNAQIYSEASHWFVTCRSGQLDDAMRRQLDRWLRQSPQHLSAYLELAAIWDEGPGLDAGRRWDVETLIAQAIADQSNVVPLTASANAEESGHTAPRHSRTRWLAASIAAFVVALGVVTMVWVQRFREPTYVTQIGEQRSIALADGSIVELNSRTTVRVRYSEHERSLDLLEGQALFRVAKDASRPFVVTADSTRVRAVGTQFDVNRKREGTVVTVVEGRVSVLTNLVDPRVDPIAVEMSMPTIPRSPHEGEEHKAGSAREPSPGILLAAGEQITVTDTATRQITRPDVARAIAWTQRQLVFDAATLTEVAEEFNRYNPRQLIVQDPDLYEFHISGVFASTDPEALLQFLRERAGVQVVETEAAIFLTKKQPETVTDR